jgi:exosortase F-associated protein
MEKTVRFLGVLMLVFLLVLVRAWEEKLFYDPLLHFFEMDYKSLPLPKMDLSALLLATAGRYGVNSLLSLAVLWLIFKDLGMLKISMLLYLSLFVVLFAVFSFIVTSSEAGQGHFLLFYVRRFLIQPLLLLVLVPAFYFQKQKST